MHTRLPVILRIRGFDIYVYPAFLFVGLTVGIIVGTIAGRADGMNGRRLYLALLLLTIPALVGSRLLYVLTHWQLYKDRPSSVWPRQEGGAALYGGLLLTLACSWPVVAVLGLSLGAFWDAATVTILVGMVFTKIGCLLNGCCVGRRTSGWLGLNLPNAQRVWCRRVPTQLMECGLAAGLVCGALLWSGPFAGARFLAALAIYAAARIPLGATRETVDRVSGVDIQAVISGILAAGSAVALAILWWMNL